MAEESIERRRPHGFALRDFFQEQWELLAGLLGGPQSGEGAELDRALESLVEGTDARMRLILNYRKRLRSGVRALLEHVEQVVGQLPSAQPLDRRSFSAHPLLGTLFSSPDDLQRTVSESSAIQALVAHKSAVGHPHFYALLTATPCEKRTLGMALHGDTLLRDVAQTAMNFSDRRVEHPSVAEGEVRRSLERALYERIVELLRARLAALRAEPGTAAELKSPDGYLDRLAALMQNPGALVNLERRHLCVSKRGVLVGPESDEPCNEFTMDELVLPELPRRLLVLISYPTAELLDREGLYGDALRGLGLFPPES